MLRPPPAQSRLFFKKQFSGERISCFSFNLLTLTQTRGRSRVLAVFKTQRQLVDMQPGWQGFQREASAASFQHHLLDARHRREDARQRPHSSFLLCLPSNSSMKSWQGDAQGGPGSVPPFWAMPGQMHTSTQGSLSGHPPLLKCSSDQSAAPSTAWEHAPHSLMEAACPIRRYTKPAAQELFSPQLLPLKS